MRLQKQLQCSFTGCNNTFIGPAQKKYCNDTICIAARKISLQESRKTNLEKDENNLNISKGKFISGTLLKIQCCATGLSGRCSNNFITVYDKQRMTYPKYCEKHRNIYQRMRFEGKTNA